ncbi:7040_t:CDS:2, partial [Funneliformis caledonium]
FENIKSNSQSAKGSTLIILESSEISLLLSSVESTYSSNENVPFWPVPYYKNKIYISQSSTLIKALPFEDSQQVTQSSGGGSRLFGGREGNRAGAGSRLTSSIGWGNKDSQVTVESVEAWENNLYIGTSDGQLIHYLLDDQVLSKDMTALPTTNFPWIKGVTCFCHDTSKEGKLERDGSVKLCVMKKRTLHIYSLTDRYSEETPMQVPDGAITACQYGPYIFVADLHQYKIINLSTKRMEIVQPYLSDIGDREAIRGIIQWEGLPRAISVEFPYVVALLRNNTIEIHDITELKLVQREVLSSKSKTISTGPGIKVQVAGLIDKLKLESGYLLNEDNSSSQLDNNTSSDVDGLQILTGSSSNQSNFLATIPTRLIIAGSESVVALAATPLIVQADSMLDSSARIDEAVELARQAMKTSTPDNVHSEIMRHESNYILQRSGFLYLGETLFEMAFPLFEEGGIDPRLLIQLFGNLREIICYDNNFTVYSGVKTIIKRLGAIDDIVSRSLVKNYDPHIKPDLESSHATKELRKVLIKNAKEMLQKFLT